jgi:hypothetical protein
MVDKKLKDEKQKKKQQANPISQLAPKKGNSAVTYNVRVKPKGPQGMMAAPYKMEKRTVKTSRGR